MPSNKAFTLLELLVVITIIGILSSIVIVSMSGSTDSATIAKGKAYSQQVHALLGANAVGVWNFDEGTENTCSATQDACDISGYNNHGTFVGDTHFIDSDIDGYALSFDGTGDYVDCGNDTSLNITGDITIEAWAKRDSIGDYMGFVGKDTGIWNDSGTYQLLYGSDNRIEFRWEKSTTHNIYIRSAGTFGTEWNHVVVERWQNPSGNFSVRMYVNGEEISINCFFSIGAGWVSIDEDSLPYPAISTAGTLEIGRYGKNPITFFNGFIDDVRIYSEALPSTEIQKHYVQGLKNLLSNQAITQAEYDQRMEEFNQSLVRHEQ
jgi:prepilin-type N-terminal cleavage/methylation domain-containing protein